MVGNVANHGYLCGIVLKELAAGRKCEITGGMLLNIKNIDDYNKYHDQLVGVFGEVVYRKDKTFIATRSPPEWARKKIHEVIWDCDEMIRWNAPKEER